MRVLAIYRSLRSREACPMGGTHALTDPSRQPAAWVGASCWRCHKTWEGPLLAPTWAEDQA